MHITEQQNKNDTVSYPCPLCDYNDICKYTETIQQTVSRKMSRGRFQYVCDVFRKRDKDNRQEEKPAKKTERTYNDIQREMLIRDFNVDVKDFKVIDECPICGSKNVLAVQCERCNRFVCTKCGEFNEIFDDTDAESIKTTSKYVCYECEKPESEEVDNDSEEDEDIIIITNND